ncbi:Unknown protein [Striga hermonthica]|uniref:Ubiquitin-like protease family profile domain-containing protein n=1 Tax=Striga hermonthica TaxID=68872 RepID=A0A9N7N174_STRHE|nr:Unknown protein [Striga hermonthica]
MMAIVGGVGDRVKIGQKQVSSKLLSSENDTKSPLKSHAKGVEENFSLEQKNVLKYMFDINLSHNETIVRMSGEFGQRMQFKQLQTSQWLSAEIINLYACMLTWDKRNNASKIPVENWFLPTYVSQFITAMKKGCDVGCIYRYFLREDKYGGDIQKCEKIFIPMNPGDHWYLCVVDIIQEEVLILDSLMSKNCNERISSAKVVLKCLHEALEIGCGATYSINIPLFPTRMAQWAPQQKNLYDCGLFTISVRLNMVGPTHYDCFSSVDRRRKRSGLLYDKVYSELLSAVTFSLMVTGWSQWRGARVPCLSPSFPPSRSLFIVGSD